MAKRNKDLVNRTEYFCAQIPSEKLLRLCSTFDQVHEWMLLKGRAQLVGKCLNARFGGLDGNPIAYLREGDPYTYNYIWAFVDLLESLFGVIQIGLPGIKKQLQCILVDEQEQTAIGLFLSCLDELFEQEFRKCLQPEYKLTVKNFETACKRARQICWDVNLQTDKALLLSEENMLPVLAWRASTVSVILGMCWDESKRDEPLKNKLVEFHVKVAHLVGAHIDAIQRSRQPSRLESQKVCSSKWEHGKFYISTQKGGGYQPAH